MGAIHATKTALEKGIETISPFQSVRAAAQEFCSLSAVVSSTHMSDTCPSTCRYKKRTQTNHWNLFLVDMGTLSCRVSMLCPSAHMNKKDHKCVYTQKVAETKAVSRYPVPCLKTASKNH